MTDSQGRNQGFVAAIRARVDGSLQRIRETMPAKYPSIRRWLAAGVTRQPAASIAGVTAGWTALWVALWLSVITAILGALGGLGVTGHFLGGSFEGAAGSVGLLAALAGAASGALVGFTAVFSSSIVTAPLRVLASVVGGFILALLITAFLIAVEPLSLKIRGYRRMSLREARTVMPIAEEVRGRLGLTSLPPFLIEDSPVLNAWSHMRAIVLTKGLLETFEADELAGIIAHELHHWSEGDAVASRFVWSCAWPVAILANVARGPVGKGQHDFIATLARFVTWPAAVLVNWFIVPLSMGRARELEYQADAAAVAAGYGAGLRKALEQMGAMETGRTGWENALIRTHPPIELRLEALDIAETPKHVAKPSPKPQHHEPREKKPPRPVTPVELHLPPSMMGLVQDQPPATPQDQQ